MSRLTSKAKHDDLSQARLMLDVLEERDVRICALLHAIIGGIAPGTYEHALYGLALQIAEDETPWLQLREALGMPKAEERGGKA